MGKKRSIEHYHHRVRSPKSQTLPPSPSHSFSSSSEFEFTISISPRNKSSDHSLCPADELFYKGQLLPLHLSPRLSMVRTLLLASPSTSSGSSSRDSTGRSSTDSHSSFNSELVLLPESCDSSRRPSSVAAEDHHHDHNNNNNNNQIKASSTSSSSSRSGNNFRYFSLPRLSSVFKREPNSKRSESGGVNSAPSSVKRMSSTAKEVIRKYLKKVKPLYEKISQKQNQQNQNQNQKLGRMLMMTVPDPTATRNIERPVKPVKKSVNGFSNSFSGNLRYPRRKSSISSCPSSIRSSPSHSGVLCRPGFGNSAGKGMFQNNNSVSLEKATSSSMEELQSAIQGAIAHCKNSLIVHHTPQQTTMTTSSDH